MIHVPINSLSPTAYRFLSTCISSFWLNCCRLWVLPFLCSCNLSLLHLYMEKKSGVDSMWKKIILLGVLVEIMHFDFRISIFLLILIVHSWPVFVSFGQIITTRSLGLGDVLQTLLKNQKRRHMWIFNGVQKLLVTF